MIPTTNSTKDIQSPPIYTPQAGFNPKKTQRVQFETVIIVLDTTYQRYIIDSVTTWHKNIEHTYTNTEYMLLRKHILQLRN